jgi:flagellar motor switch protein FliM
MGQKPAPFAPTIGTPPRHALEAAEASGTRIQSAVRRVAARIAGALDAARCGAVQPRRFSCADSSAGRRDQHDAVFADTMLCGAIALEPVHLPALLIAPRALAAALVECSYGGRIDALGSGQMRRPGYAEAREFAGLLQDFAQALQTGCEDRIPVAAEPRASFDSDSARDILPPGEAVAVIHFDLHLPPARDPFRLTLMLPLAALRASTVLQASLATRDAAARQRWQGALSRRSGDIAMPARSVIARPMLSMGQLMALRPGDVIPISMPRHVPLLIADRRVATGTIGECDGRVAFMIDSLEPEHVR